MNHTQLLFFPLNEAIMSGGTFSWLALSLLVTVIFAGLVYGWLRIRFLNNQKAELVRQVVERNELLAFATEREKRAQDNMMHLHQNSRKLLNKINHDLRTPMNGVMGMADLLSETPLSNEQRDYCETIRNSGERVLAVMNDILQSDTMAPDKSESIQQQHEPRLITEQSQTPRLSANFSQDYPLHILIAEDDRINQKLAMKILCKLGYNPDIAQDGNEVLEMVSNIKYDLVLMDVQMPEMDGLEATRMIRLCLPVQPVIIAMTANSLQGDRDECLQAGMDDYISKPVHLEKLVSLLEKWALTIKERNNAVNITPLHLPNKLS